MLATLASSVAGCGRALEEFPQAPSALRTSVRVLLGLLIVMLLTYIAIEQLGSLRRRRSTRER
jgi:hypothetical protein